MRDTFYVYVFNPDTREGGLINQPGVRHWFKIENARTEAQRWGGMTPLAISEIEPGRIAWYRDRFALACLEAWHDREKHYTAVVCKSIR